MIVVGIAGVVGVLVALLAMGEGYAETLRKTGSDDTAIVMRGASAAEVMSVLDHDSVDPDPAGAGHRTRRQGTSRSHRPNWSSPPTCRSRAATADDEGSVQLRGVGEQAWAVRPNVKIIDGRNFQPGMRELVVGKGAAKAVRRVWNLATRSISAASRGPWSACSPPAMRWTRRYGATPTWSPTPIGAAAAARR